MDKHRRIAFWFVIGSIFGGIVFSANQVYAINFTTPVQLSIDDPDPFTGAVSTLTAQYFNESWFVTFDDIRVVAVVHYDAYIGKWNDDLSTRLDGVDQITDADSQNKPRQADMQVGYPDNQNLTVAYRYNDDVFKIKNISVSDLTEGAGVNIDTSIGSTETISMSKTWQYNQLDPSLDNFRIVYGSTSSLDYWDGSTHSLYTPTAYSTGNITLLFNQIYQSYILLFEHSDGNIYALYYDGDFNYLDDEKIIDVDNAITYVSADIFDNELWVTGIYDKETVIIDIFHIVAIDDLSLVTEYTVNITNVESTTAVRTPYLSYDYDEFQKHLFYSLYNTTVDETEGIYFMAEDVFCECTSWTNTSDCIDVYRVQTRVCTPRRCLNETDYVWDSICNKTKDLIDRHELQDTERFCESQSCDTGWVDPAETGSAQCEASLVIDGDCSANIESNATIRTHVKRTSGWTFGSLGTAKYGLLLCNPLDNCFEEYPLCESQWNRTQTLQYGDYYPNDTATAHFQLMGTTPCKAVRSWMRDYGWDRYMVSGELQYCCDRTCGGWKCIQRGLLEYRILQYPDCLYNESSKELCSMGCKGGECLSELQAEITRSPSGNPFDWILGEAEHNFPVYVLNVMAVGVSTGGGIYASMLTNKWQIGAMATMGFILFFLTLGWLPIVIGILWIIAVVLLLAKMITGMKGG